jgi:hypothetical protein
LFSLTRHAWSFFDTPGSRTRARPGPCARACPAVALADVDVAAGAPVPAIGAGHQPAPEGGIRTIPTPPGLLSAAPAPGAGHADRCTVDAAAATVRVVGRNLSSCGTPSPCHPRQTQRDRGGRCLDQDDIARVSESKSEFAGGTYVADGSARRGRSENDLAAVPDERQRDSCARSPPAVVRTSRLILSPTGARCGVRGPSGC